MLYNYSTLQKEQFKEIIQSPVTCMSTMSRCKFLNTKVHYGNSSSKHKPQTFDFTSCFL